MNSKKKKNQNFLRLVHYLRLDTTRFYIFVFNFEKKNKKNSILIKCLAFSSPTNRVLCSSRPLNVTESL